MTGGKPPLYLRGERNPIGTLARASNRSAHEKTPLSRHLLAPRGRLRALAQILQQRRLAHARLAAHHEHAAAQE
jgi:hypothetical protein